MKVSIITINYNNRAGLERTMQSVLSQTVYDDIEYIVVDGASTDGSVEVLKQYESLLSFAISEPDSGIYNAMNKGVKRAAGDYCLFLNSGDVLHDDKVIEDCIPYLGGEDFVMGKIMFFPSKRLGWFDITAPITMMDFYKGGPVPHQATFIRRSLFQECLYDESLKIVSDWKFFLWMIVFQKKTYVIVDNIVADFEEFGISSNRYRCDIERKKVLEQILPPAILLDYMRFENGKEYTDDNYNKFFVELRKYCPKMAVLVYKVALHATKFLARFKPSLAFSEKFGTRGLDWK